MAYSNYIELAARLNDDLWARRGNDNGGKIYTWEDRRDTKKKGVQIVCQGKVEDTAVNIKAQQMAKAVKDAYLIICKRIGLEPNLPKKNDYAFRPAYYEWHLTDGNGRVLLNWVDPADNFVVREDDDENDEYDVERPMTYDEVLAECEEYIQCGNDFFNEADEEDEEEGYHGVKREDFIRLPENAADIMATALFYYYCYEPSEADENNKLITTNVI